MGKVHARTLPSAQIADIPADKLLCSKLADTEKLKGNESMKAGDHAEAVVYYTRSLQYADTVAARNNRSLAHIKLEQHVEAEQDLDLVLQQQPANTKVGHVGGGREV